MLEIFHFFYPSQRVDEVKHQLRKLVLKITRDDSGKSVSEIVDASQQSNPLVGMTYDKFTLSAMLQAGVSYKSLQISPDYRLGLESEIEQFNQYLDDNAEKLFIEPKTE